MTEREKMISGALYDPSEAALLAARNAAKEQCVQYNSLPPSAADQRDALLRGLLGSCGTHVLIEPSFFCDYGFHIHVGEHFYANHNLVILDAAPVVLASMSLSPPTAAFIPRRILLMLPSAMRSLNMPSPSESAVTSGSEGTSASSPA